MQPLEIERINVPQLVRVGELEHVILDCEYDFEDTKTDGLVLQWYFNENTIAYQWIYGREPLAADPVKKHIDLGYKSSNDSFHMYRSMKLREPGIELSGDYKCVVSTLENEVSAVSTMIVFCE